MLTTFGQQPQPQRLSNSVNTPLHEYWATIAANDSMLIFTRLVTTQGIRNEDLYFSTRDSEGNWHQALPLNALNTPENEGAQTLSANGHFMIFTSCNNQQSYGSCDLFYSIKIGENWLPPRNLGKRINTKAWETQPSLSADGTELYFVSNRVGGKGGMDIWHSKLQGIDEQGNMQWSAPTNLNINTAKDEMSPFIHADNQTLYFSSNGYKPTTDFDIYISRKDKTAFDTPENIGKPLNTTADELGFAVNASGTMAYFSSDRENGNRDIYSFPIPVAHRPKQVQIVQGKVQNKATQAPLAATLTLQALEDSTEYHTITDFSTGEYLLCLTQGKQWRLSAQANGYFFHSENIDLRNQDLAYQHRDIMLLPIQKGAKISLNNVFFDTDKASLKQESIIELEQVKLLLLHNPSLKISLSGHTDNKGTASHNQALSEARARAVYDWLIKQGISPQRLSAKGYGETVPTATNATEEGRTQNRRTELKVIEYQQ